MADSDEDVVRAAPSSSSGGRTSELVAVPAGGGGVFDSLNSSLRSDLESTRREVSLLAAASAKRRAQLAEIEAEEAEEDELVADELAKLRELMDQELSPDEDEQPQPTRQQQLRDRARTADKGHTRTRTGSTADGHVRATGAARRAVSSAAASSSAAAAAAAAASSPWSSPSPTAAASSTPLSPSHAATLQRSRDVLSSYRAQQNTVAAYEADQQAARRNEGELEGTIKLKSDLGEQCAICLDDMVALERVASLSCCHTFHSSCILEWMKRSNACPLCKTEGFHPLAAVARQQNAPISADPVVQRPPSAQSSNGYSAPRSSSRPSSAMQRPTSALLDAATRAHLRQLRAERVHADGLAQDARRGHNSSASLGGGSASVFERRAASAAQNAATAASAHLRAAPGSMSLSQLLASAPPPGSLQHALLTGSQVSSSSQRGSSARTAPRASPLRGLDPRASLGSTISSSPVGPVPFSSPSLPPASRRPPSVGPVLARPSSNSSSIRAAAAASLALAPTVTKAATTGRLATGSTLHRSK